MPGENWFYVSGGQQLGPVDIASLQQMAASGQLQAQDMVWTDGLTEWAPASKIAAIFGQAAVPTATADSAMHPIGYFSPPVSVEYAGFWMRVLAYLIDAVIMVITGALLGGCVGVVIGGMMGLRGSGPQEIRMVVGPIANLLGIIAGWLYWALMESSASQATLGKMALGLTVTDLAGQRISFGRATGRYFSKWISAILFCIGFVMVAFTDRKQGLHDMIASTLVVKK